MIDSHAHLDFPEFDHDREQLFKEMKAASISSALIPGVSPSHWPKQLQVANQYSCTYALGIHPWYVTDEVNTQLSQLVDIINVNATDNNLVALGECGLDKIKLNNWELQLFAFEAQIKLAKHYQLPLIVHSVKAHNEVILLLKKHQLSKAGIVHGFYGSVEIARQYLDLGFKLGIGGLLLNDNAKKLRNAVQILPINSFVVETDSPAMLPKNRDGSRNTPLLVNEIVIKIADLQGESTVLVREQLQASYCQVVDM